MYTFSLRGLGRFPKSSSRRPFSPPPPEPMARPMIIPIARDSRATTAHIHTLTYPDTSARERVC